MVKTRDLFKKIRDTKGIFHAKMGLIKERNGKDPDLHTGFSRARSGGLVFPSLSEFSTVYCDPHSQRLRPPPGDLPNPGVEPRSLPLQADSLPSEPLGEPKNTGVGRLLLLQGNLPTQELNWGLLHCIFSCCEQGLLFFVVCGLLIVATSCRVLVLGMWASCCGVQALGVRA